MRSLRSAVSVVALLLAACAGPGASGPAARPAPLEQRALLWEVTRPGASGHPLFLTGSIHVGKPDQFPFPPSVEEAFAKSTALVVELDPDKAQEDSQKTQQVVLALGLSRTQPLSKSVSPATLALLPAGLERVGLSLPQVEAMRPWFASVTLQVLDLQKAGYSEKGGIDLALLKRARGKKTVVELETLEGQLHTLADLPADVQDLMLREALQSGPLIAISFATMATAWEGGNADALADQVFSSAKDPGMAPMYEALFYKRNREMAKRAAGLLDQPGVHFVVVGAGHVVGPQGLPALLAQQGFTVRQVARSGIAAP